MMLPCEYCPMCAFTSHASLRSILPKASSRLNLAVASGLDLRCRSAPGRPHPVRQAVVVRRGAVIAQDLDFGIHSWGRSSVRVIEGCLSELQVVPRRAWQNPWQDNEAKTLTRSFWRWFWRFSQAIAIDARRARRGEAVLQVGGRRRRLKKDWDTAVTNVSEGGGCGPDESGVMRSRCGGRGFNPGRSTWMKGVKLRTQDKLTGSDGGVPEGAGDGPGLAGSAARDEADAADDAVDKDRGAVLSGADGADGDGSG